MDHFSLISYDVQTAARNQIVVLVSGNQIYKQLLTRAFAGHFVSRTFEDRYGRFDWGFYVHEVSPGEINDVKRLLELCKQHIFLYDDLTECFALDYHTRLSSGGYQRTEIGELVYKAKPYSRKPTESHYDAAARLAQRMVRFIEEHPTYRRCEVIVSAPPSRLGKPFDLPSQLAGRILDSNSSLVDGRHWIRKVKNTRPMKDCVTIPEKIANVKDAFELSSDSKIHDRNVLVVDDIYESGFTLNEVSRLLLGHGAKAVFGLVGTKTGRDMQ